MKTEKPPMVGSEFGLQQRKLLFRHLHLNGPLHLLREAHRQQSRRRTEHSRSSLSASCFSGSNGTENSAKAFSFVDGFEC
jgi:hypothetical protein